MLAEPASICERALRHVSAIGGRQPGADPGARARRRRIGMLSDQLPAPRGLRGLDGRPSAARTAQEARLVAASGARYVSTAETSPAALAEEAGGFDIVIEAAGDAQVMLDALGLLRRNGVACLLGIDGRPQR